MAGRMFQDEVRKVLNSRKDPDSRAALTLKAVLAHDKLIPAETSERLALTIIRHLADHCDILEKMLIRAIVISPPTPLHLEELPTINCEETSHEKSDGIAKLPG